MARLPVSVFLPCVLALPALAHAQQPDDELIVTATRAEGGIPRELLGASVTTLSSEDLKERQARSMADILRDVPGVSVSRAGPLGAVTQVRLRGTEANHVLVLVDGMEVTDPFLGEFDFSGLQLDEAARIEVLRGPQSALYGSDAVGGVIQYFTLSGREAPGASLRAEGGSFGSREFAGRLAGASGTVDYSLAAGAQDSEGTPTSRFGNRDIGASNRVLSARAGWQPRESFALHGVLRVSRANADYNPQDFDFTSPTYGYVVDGDGEAKTRNLQGLVAADFGSPTSRVHHTVSVQGLEATRDSRSAGVRDGGDEGERLKGSWVSTIVFGDAGASQRLTLALDREHESFRNNGPFASAAQADRHSIENTGTVAQYELLLAQRTGISLAARHDANGRFDDAGTWRVQLSQALGEGGLRVHAAAGTGIKNPTPTELFGFDPDTFVGNPDLKPERSRAWEVGFEQALLEGEALRVGGAWSRAVLKHEIYTRYSPSFVASPDNRDGRSHQSSAEGWARLALGRHWRVDAAFTWLRAREDDAPEVRRPPHSGSLNLLWQSADARDAVNLTARFNGATEDYNFTAVGPPRVRLGGYTLLQLSARHSLTPGVELFGRIENALDQAYEDIYTYRMPGRAVYAGLRASL